MSRKSPITKMKKPLRGVECFIDYFTPEYNWVSLCYTLRLFGFLKFIQKVPLLSLQCGYARPSPGDMGY